MINWKVRLNNPNFWLALIPALLILIQAVAALLGVTLDLSEVGEKLVSVVNAAFALLAIVGVVNDPTTAGMGDSKLAMTYTRPKMDIPADPYAILYPEELAAEDERETLDF